MISATMPGTRCRAIGLIGALAVPSAALVQPAAAATGPVITTYGLNGGYVNPDGITEGPDGNMWFTEFSDAFTIGEITPGGSITDHPVPGPGDSAAGGITLSPDRHAVPAPDGYLGRITTTGTARVLRYAASPQNVTAGPHHSTWYTTGTVSQPGGSIVRISRRGKVTTWTGPDVSGPYWITEGPCGTMWFTNNDGNSIGRISRSGHITTFTGPDVVQPVTIARGPGGDMWFGNAGYSSLGRITPAGHITSYSGGDIGTPFGVTEGPDGAMWFTNYSGNAIGRITMSGQITTYPIPGGIASPQVITPGPGRTL
jgi:virginiamycin B lyase